MKRILLLILLFFLISNTVYGMDYIDINETSLPVEEGGTIVLQEEQNSSTIISAADNPNSWKNDFRRIIDSYDIETGNTFLISSSININNVIASRNGNQSGNLEHKLWKCYRKKGKTMISSLKIEMER